MPHSSSGCCALTTLASASSESSPSCRAPACCQPRDSESLPECVQFNSKLASVARKGEFVHHEARLARARSNASAALGPAKRPNPPQWYSVVLLKSSFDVDMTAGRICRRCDNGERRATLCWARLRCASLLSPRCRRFSRSTGRVSAAQNVPLNRTLPMPMPMIALATGA